MGITPRHNNPKKVSLDDLDDHLKMTIDESSDEHPFTYVIPSHIAATVDDLYKALTQNGYTVVKESESAWKIS